ncbi:MAG: malonyl-ACP O-methyltransferase BioC, partial [Nitrospinaceae bacterium]
SPQNNDIEFEIIESFSKHVKSYDKNAQLQKTMAERLAALLPKTLPERVLEVGCGTGIFTRHLLVRQVKHLILNDIAPAMLDHLKSHLPLPQNHKILTGNAEKIRFDPVDIVVANAVFQWFLRPVETLQHMGRSLRPGGRLLFSTFGPKTLEEFRATAQIDSPITLYSFNQWKSKIRSAGFKLIESDSETRKTFFPNSLALLKSLQQVGAAPLRRTSSGSLRSLMRKYDEAFTTDQGVYATWELYYFSAAI